MVSRRHANDRTIPGKQNAKPTQNADGTLNFEKQQNREQLMEPLDVEVKDLEMRVRQILRNIDKALKASDIKAFKEELVVLSDKITQLKVHDVPKTVNALLTIMETFEKSRGRNLNRHDLESYRNDIAKTGGYRALLLSEV